MCKSSEKSIEELEDLFKHDEMNNIILSCRRTHQERN